MTPRRRWLLLGYASTKRADKPVVSKTCVGDAELDRELALLEADSRIKRTTVELAP